MSLKQESARDREESLHLSFDAIPRGFSSLRCAFEHRGIVTMGNFSTGHVTYWMMSQSRVQNLIRLTKYTTVFENGQVILEFMWKFYGRFCWFFPFVYFAWPAPGEVTYPFFVVHNKPHLFDKWWKSLVYIILWNEHEAVTSKLAERDDSVLAAILAPVTLWKWWRAYYYEPLYLERSSIKLYIVLESIDPTNSRTSKPCWEFYDDCWLPWSPKFFKSKMAA